MGDVYAVITQAAPEVVDRVAHAMEVSAADPQHADMVDAYLADASIPEGAHVLEVGCGTGAIARMLAERISASEIVGVDPSPILITRARALSGGNDRLRFEEGDGRGLAQADASVDVVLLHRVLSHVPEPERVLAEAFRVLRPAGRLIVFDGDYATISLSLADHDPLRVCVDAFRPAYISDPWVARRLGSLARAAGFELGRTRSHGYLETASPDYMLSIADRGADALVAAGTIGEDLAAALKREARRRADATTFYGHVAYVSLIARRPGSPRSAAAG